MDLDPHFPRGDGAQQYNLGSPLFREPLEESPLHSGSCAGDLVLRLGSASGSCVVISSLGLCQMEGLDGKSHPTLSAVALGGQNFWFVIRVLSAW